MYVSPAGFYAVLSFVAKAGGMKTSYLITRLAQGAAMDHGYDPAKLNREANVKWLLKRLSATTPEAQWDLVRRVEPLFIDAWKQSKEASRMMRCAQRLFPGPNADYMPSEVRLAACEVAISFLPDVPEKLHKEIRAMIAAARSYAKHGSSTLYDEMIQMRKKVRCLDKVHPVYPYMFVSSSEGADRMMASIACDAGNRAVDTFYMHSLEPYGPSRMAKADKTWYDAYNKAERKNANIIRRSMGTPGLMLLMRLNKMPFENILLKSR